MYFFHSKFIQIEKKVRTKTNSPLVNSYLNQFGLCKFCFWNIYSIWFCLFCFQCKLSIYRYSQKKQSHRDEQQLLLYVFILSHKYRNFGIKCAKFGIRFFSSFSGQYVGLYFVKFAFLLFIDFIHFEWTEMSIINAHDFSQNHPINEVSSKMAEVFFSSDIIIIYAYLYE